MLSRHRRWLRPALGAMILLVLVGVVGPGAIVRGVRAIDPVVALAAVALTAACTALACWRWVAIARACGLRLRFGDAVGAYYRSQLINATVPGGVVGDVDRAVWHARDQRDARRAGGAVVVERTVGQAVFLLLAAVVALGWGAGAGLPWPVMAALAGACLACAGAALAVGGATRVLAADRASTRLIVPVVVASVLVAAGYTTLFVVTARAVGVDLPLDRVVPLAVVVLVASAIPIHLAGWGPREGVAAWAFAAAGLGAELGLAVSVAYGVVSLVAVLPGVVPLVVGRTRSARVPSAVADGADGPGHVAEVSRPRA